MVRRAWVLAGVMMATGGCDADTLGIHVPRGGRAMLEPTVFKRDLWRVTDPRIGGRVPGSSGARRVAQYIAERLEFYGLKPVFGGEYRRDLGRNVGEMVCGVRRGSGEDAVVVAADEAVVVKGLQVAAVVAVALAVVAAEVEVVVVADKGAHAVAMATSVAVTGLPMQHASEDFRGTLLIGAVL